MGQAILKEREQQGLSQASCLGLPPKLSKPPAFGEEWLREQREVESVLILLLMKIGAEFLLYGCMSGK